MMDHNTFYSRGHIFCLLNMAGLTGREETSQELKSYRIKRDNSDLQMIISVIEDTLNPFKVHDRNLYCLTSGRAASKSVTQDMLAIVTKGDAWFQEFVKECKTSANRFEKPTRRRKVNNFAADAIKIKVLAKDQKVKEVCCTRDLFGRLLYLAASQNVDLETVLSYSLTPVPLSLSH